MSHETIADYRPNDLGKFTSINLNNVRDWRAQGWMDEYGESSETGRWKYSLRDIVALHVADRLAGRGRAVPRADALRYGHSNAEMVIHCFHMFRCNWAPLDPYSRRFSVIFHDGQGDQARPDGSGAIHINDLREVHDRFFDVAVIIDIHHLAKTLPVLLKTELVAASEGVGVP